MSFTHLKRVALGAVAAMMATCCVAVVPAVANTPTPKADASAPTDTVSTFMWLGITTVIVFGVALAYVITGRRSAKALQQANAAKSQSQE